MPGGGCNGHVANGGELAASQGRDLPKDRTPSLAGTAGTVKARTFPPRRLSGPPLMHREWNDCRKQLEASLPTQQGQNIFFFPPPNLSLAKC